MSDPSHSPSPSSFPLLLSFSYVSLFPSPSSSPLLLLSSPPSSLVTPNGLTSIPAGVETSEMIQLRTKVIEEEGGRGRKKGRFVEERDGRNHLTIVFKQTYYATVCIMVMM